MWTPAAEKMVSCRRRTRSSCFFVADAVGGVARTTSREDGSGGGAGELDDQLWIEVWSAGLDPTTALRALAWPSQRSEYAQTREGRWLFFRRLSLGHLIVSGESTA